MSLAGQRPTRDSWQEGQVHDGAGLLPMRGLQVRAEELEDLARSLQGESSIPFLRARVIDNGRTSHREVPTYATRSCCQARRAPTKREEGRRPRERPPLRIPVRVTGGGGTRGQIGAGLGAAGGARRHRTPAKMALSRGGGGGGNTLLPITSLSPHFWIGARGRSWASLT